jgi:hypothetical protein
LPIVGWVGISWRVVAVSVLLGLLIAAFGWIEDVAAGRRPVLVPGRRIPVPVSPAPTGTTRPEPAVSLR